MTRTSWHPAVVQAFGNELEDCRKDLAFEAEHQLTTEPLRIDVLVIKKKRDVVLEKNIALIFRQFNIIEYKSPDDSVTVEDYHKVHVYARLYASLNKVDISDVSVTVVATRHPRKLLTFVKNQFTTHQKQPGIYIVKGEIYPTQIIVGGELSKRENFWLANLRNDLTTEQLTQVLTAAVGKSETDAYIHAITHANATTLEELYMRRKEGVIFTEKLDAYFNERYGATYFAQGRAVGEAEGKAVGEAEGKTETARNLLLAILQKKFSRIPKKTERAIRQMVDPIALESWAVQASMCQTLDEFLEALN